MQTILQFNVILFALNCKIFMPVLYNHSLYSPVPEILKCDCMYQSLLFQVNQNPASADGLHSAVSSPVLDARELAVPVQSSSALIVFLHSNDAMNEKQYYAQFSVHRKYRFYSRPDKIQTQKQKEAEAASVHFCMKKRQTIDQKSNLILQHVQSTSY